MLSVPSRDVRTMKQDVRMRDIISGKVSVILVSHNGLHETTAPCLRSIIERTTHNNYEIIVVDNNSCDGTQDYLKSLAALDSRVRPVLNRHNKGFAAGNNDGIMAANGDYLIFLNNDTLVTEGWLDKLILPLLRDQTVGLVGPVTNSVGNEQRIYTEATATDEVVQEGLLWASMSLGDFFETDLLSFFCVAARRELITAIGLLDESFGLGFYEDDDYCIRTRQAGFRLICAEDVFVYHKGSASFGKIQSPIKTLLKKNKKILERKFNIRYHPRHPREKLFSLVELYLRRACTENMTEGLKYKIDNRLKLLDEWKPRNFLKRAKHNRKMRHLASTMTSL